MPTRPKPEQVRKARSGGRPSRQEAARLEQRILDAATELFLSDGYAATSIEAVARRARISKRTFYHRFTGKADIFAAVARRLLARLRPPDENRLFAGASLEAVLLGLATAILQAALAAEAVSLQRLLLSEAGRIPELADIVHALGARREAIDRIAALLQKEKEKGRIAVADAHFAAAQFLHMVIAEPQRRAMGLGEAMTQSQRDGWARQTVALFLRGIEASA